MPGISPILGLPMADQDADFVTDFPDAVDIPRTTGLEKYTIPRFANAGERDTKIPAPVAGMACYLTDLMQFQGRDAAGWYPIGGYMPAARAWTNGSVSAASGWTEPTFNGTIAQGGITFGTGKRIIVPFKALYTFTVQCDVSAITGTAGLSQIVLNGTGMAMVSRTYSSTALQRGIISTGQYWADAGDALSVPLYLDAAANITYSLQVVYGSRWV